MTDNVIRLPGGGEIVAPEGTNEIVRELAGPIGVAIKQKYDELPPAERNKWQSALLGGLAFSWAGVWGFVLGGAISLVACQGIQAITSKERKILSKVSDALKGKRVVMSPEDVETLQGIIDKIKAESQKS